MLVINTDVWFLIEPFLNLKPGEVVEISEKPHTFLSHGGHFVTSFLISQLPNFRELLGKNRDKQQTQ